MKDSSFSDCDASYLSKGDLLPFLQNKVFSVWDWAIESQKVTASRCKLSFCQLRLVTTCTLITVSKAGFCKLFNNAERYLKEERGLSEPVLFVLKQTVRVHTASDHVGAERFFYCTNQIVSDHLIKSEDLLQK